MLFKKTKGFKGLESFDSSKCKVEKEKIQNFKEDEVAMGCIEGCWSGPIWSVNFRDERD